MIVLENKFSFDRQKIINFERKLIENPYLEGLPQPCSSGSSKYTVCEMNEKINQLIGDSPYNLRWIGSDPSSYIRAYLYSILMLAIEDNSEGFMLFKNVLYQTAMKNLKPIEQKLLIEFLCLIEFSSDKFLFLKKYPKVEKIMIKLFKAIEEDKDHSIIEEEGELFQSSESKVENHLRIFHGPPRDHSFVDDEQEDDSLGNKTERDARVLGMNKIIELYSKLAVKFPFIQWGKSSSSTFTFTSLSGQRIYILVEKEYFFVLQPLRYSELPKVQNNLSNKGQYFVDKDEVQRLLFDKNETTKRSPSNEPLTFENTFLHSTAKITPITTNEELVFKKKKSEEFKEQINPMQYSIPISQQRQQSDFNPKLYQTMQSNKSKGGLKFPLFSKKNVANPNQKQRSDLNLSKEKQLSKKPQYLDLFDSSFEKEQQDEDQQRRKSQEKGSHQKSKQKQNFKPRPLKFLEEFKTKDKYIASIEKRAKSPEFLSKNRQPSQAKEPKLKKIISPTKPEEQSTNKADSKERKQSSPSRIPFAKNQSLDAKRQSPFKDWKNYKKKQVLAKKKEAEINDKIYFERKEEISKKNNLKGKTATNTNRFSPVKAEHKLFDKIMAHQEGHITRAETDGIGINLQKAIQNLTNEQSEISNGEQSPQFSKTLNNNNSESLKKKIFDHAVKKFGRDNLFLHPKSRNKSQQGQKKLVSPARIEQNLSKVPKIFQNKHKLNLQTPESPESPFSQSNEANYQIFVNTPDQSTT